MTASLEIEPGRAAGAVSRRLARWGSERFAHRLWAKDPTLWFADPRPEIVDRLGWLELPDPAKVAAIEAFAATIVAGEIDHVVLLGMGGSSLAPQVYGAVFGERPGHPHLVVLDSTHPDAVAAVDERVDPGRALFIVASKSGTTLETMSFFRFFWARVAERTDDPGSRFVAITDPGTPLDSLAVERAFRAIFHAPDDVGGRYSALTDFGLVPAALTGVEIRSVLDRAAEAMDACAPGVPVDENPALVLGATLGELAASGTDKLVFLFDPPFGEVPDWTEQLIAESLGKDGRGIVPVPHPARPAPWADRWVMTSSDQTIDDLPRARLTLEDPADLGAAFFLLELAVAAAGSVLGVHPFDQPDVQAAKEFARTAMGSTAELDVERMSLGDPAVASAVAAVLGDLTPPRYLAMQAYLAPTTVTTEQLDAIRGDIEAATTVVSTLGYGPRFLHSTGQLHKGGPDTGVFLQIVDRPRRRLDVPGTDFSFQQLIAAQAAGDQAALRQRGRTVLMIDIGETEPSSLSRLRLTVGTAMR